MLSYFLVSHLKLLKPRKTDQFGKKKIRGEEEAQSKTPVYTSLAKVQNKSGEEVASPQCLQLFFGWKTLEGFLVGWLVFFLKSQ